METSMAILIQVMLAMSGVSYITHQLCVLCKGGGNQPMIICQVKDNERKTDN